MEEDSEILEQSTQHIKDFKLAIEFKYLMKHAPAGVYLMPEFDNIRRLHGVIFVRRGLYRDGVFRFVMNLPLSYNDMNTHPEIIFTPPIFNPLIDPDTGLLDLRIDEYLQQWQPERHFIVTALTFLKRIFYMKSYDNFSSVPNEEARTLFKVDKEEFWNHVSAAVDDSLNRVHEPPPPLPPSSVTISTEEPEVNEESTTSTIIFTEPQPAHENVIRRVLFRPRGDGDVELSENKSESVGDGEILRRASPNSAD